MTLLPIAVLVSLATNPGVPPRDIVGEWIDRTVALGYRTSALPTMNARCVALVAVAMFDALDALDPRFAPFGGAATVRGAAGGNAAGGSDAAAAAAAHHILKLAYPDQVNALDSALSTSLAGLNESARAAGVQLGTDVASRLWTERASDGSDAPNIYRPATTAGVYTATALPLGATWGAVKPFVLQSGNQFRPGPPPA